MMKNRRSRFLSMMLAITLMLTAIPMYANAASTTFINPVAPYSSADPFVMKHTDGYYYFVHTSQNWDKIDISRASSLTGIGNGTRKTVFTQSSTACTGSNCYSDNVWAPELHYISGAWYLYFSAGSNEANTPNQRMWVTKNTSANPLEGSWSAPVKLKDTADYWSIDHTVATINGQLYIAWSEIAPNQPQRIMIAKMSSPTAISGRGTVISTPTNSWETSGSPVNEAPAFITHGSKVHLAFSASGCWTDDYKLGLLSANITADLTVAGNWTKNASPVFQKTSTVFGPGHNSFVKSPDGTEDWIVYHANDGSGQGCADQRTTRIQKITWSGDTPVFGTPVNPATAITRPSGEGTGDIYYRIVNRNSGKVMAIDTASTADGANILQWTYDGSGDQRWALDPVSGGYFKLRASHSGKLAEVYEKSLLDGGNVVQWADNGGLNQMWSFIPTGNQYFEIKNRNSGKLLDVTNGGLTDGVNIGQWSDLNNTIQQWKFERVN
ncbi:GH43 family beta-xylosidase [Paenibacillus phyllosphaerae]|uniref:GH43 family beta-xylosidase n=1 Tax=Paenibacillus phyllosphaerae TaxID=274593 RepID=A0A7W5AWE1_9BACL|nr:family 43 glycosylhydrolase [Paenibacillus phyllosphaerae]MBB3110044.1 GH43 family beta-xylosidase [Paenibacillus phyllosphaerae]